MNVLPDKISDLLNLALNDLAAIEQDDMYIVNMYSWHSNSPFHYKCSVCLAGSVMAKSLDTANYYTVYPCDFPDEIGDKLYVLDELRQGRIPGHAKMNRDVPEYDQNKEGWWTAMRTLVEDLKQAGL